MNGEKQRVQIIRGTEYVYIDQPYWDKEKKRGSHRRIYIGKNVDGEFVPNARYKELQRAKEDAGLEGKCNSQICRRRFRGVTWLFWEIAKALHMTDDLKDVFPNCWRELLSLAFYLAHDQNQVMYRYQHWADRTWVPTEVTLSSQRISELLGTIGESQKMAYFRMQTVRLAEKEYLAYDTTSISSYSKLISQVRYGKNKDHDPLPQINLAMLYGAVSRLPVYYRKLPGNTPDVKTLQTLLKAVPFLLGCQVRLIMDRGFYSVSNVDEMLIQRCKFLIGVPASRRIVQNCLDPVRDNLVHRRNYDSNTGLYTETFTITWEFDRARPRKRDTIREKRRLYLHLYYNEHAAADARRELNNRLDDYEKELRDGCRRTDHEKAYSKYFTVRTVRGHKKHLTYNEEAIEKEIQNAGWFALLSNGISSGRDAVQIYRTRDLIEKCFEDLKGRLSMHRMAVASEENVEGKLFVQFLALQLLSYIQDKMNQNGLFRKYTLQGVLDELDDIEYFETPAKRGWFSEILQKQVNLYNALNITPPA